MFMLAGLGAENENENENENKNENKNMNENENYNDNDDKDNDNVLFSFYLSFFLFRVVVARAKSLHDRCPRKHDLLSTSSTESADSEFPDLKPLRVGFTFL